MENQSQNQPESQPNHPAKQPSCACTMSPWRWLGLILLVIAAILLIGENKSGPTGNGVKWHDNYDQAAQIAQQQNKPLLLAFHASWCPPCKMMKKETYTNAEVINMIESNFVPIMVDVDSQKKLVEKFNIVNGIPAYTIVKADGTILSEFIGFNESAKFIEKLKSALNP